jgi:hypothetical protein
MAHHPKTSAKNAKGESPEYAAFSDALRTVLQVSHSELQSRIEADKKMRKRKSNASASRAKGGSAKQN